MPSLPCGCRASGIWTSTDTGCPVPKAKGWPTMPQHRPQTGIPYECQFKSSLPHLWSSFIKAWKSMEDSLSVWVTATHLERPGRIFFAPSFSLATNLSFRSLGEWTSNGSSVFPYHLAFQTNKTNKSLKHTFLGEKKVNCINMWQMPKSKTTRFIEITIP